MYNETLVSSLGFGLRLFIEKLPEGLDAPYFIGCDHVRLTEDLARARIGKG